MPRFGPRRAFDNYALNSLKRGRSPRLDLHYAKFRTTLRNVHCTITRNMIRTKLLHIPQLTGKEDLSLVSLRPASTTNFLVEMNVAIKGNLTDKECQLLQSIQVNSKVCIHVAIENRNKSWYFYHKLGQFYHILNWLLRF